MRYIIISLIIIFTYSIALVSTKDIKTLSELTTKSNDPILYTEFGWALLFNNQPERATVAFNLALKNDPKNIDALEGLFLSEKMTGDYKNASQALSKLIRFYPNDPRSFVYLPILFTLLEDVSKRSTMLELLNYVLEKTEANPLMKDLCSRYKTLCLIDMGRPTEASDIITTLGFIKKWWFIGPFDNEGKVGFVKVYPPETEINLDAKYEGKKFSVNWRLMPYESPNGEIYLKRMLYPSQNSTAYLLVSVYSPTTRTVALKVGSSGAVKAFLNGKKILENNVYRIFAYDQEITPCVLKAGYNLLLIKSCSLEDDWICSARFTELDGSPITDIKTSTNIKDIFIASKQTPITPSSQDISKLNKGYLDLFIKQAINNTNDPMPFIYLSFLESRYHFSDVNDEKEARLYKNIIDILPKWGYGQFLLGTTNPGGNTSRYLYESAINSCPELAEAWMELGRLFYDNGRYENAIEAFRYALTINPDFIEPRQYIAKIAYENNWNPLAKIETDELLARNKDYIYAYYNLGRLSEHIGIDIDAINYYSKILNIEANSYYAISSLVEKYKQTGKVNDAIELLKGYINYDPYNTTLRKDLLRLYIDTELFNNALNTADELLEINPRDFETLSWKGVVLHKIGKKNEAIENFEKAVEYKQNYPWLSTYISQLKPAEKTYFEHYILKREDVIERVGDLSVYSNEQAIYLLDQQIRKVYPNGTSSYTVHKIIKINSEDALQKFSNMEIYYVPEREDVKILTASVVLPTGEEIVATDIKDYSISSESERLYYDYMSKVVNFPALKSGAIIDFEYSVDQTSENIFSDYFWEQFFFGNYEPTLISEYILIVPENKRFHFNFPPSISEEVSPSSDSITYILKKENIEGIFNEPSMPSISEMLDSVKVSSFTSWDEVGRWYWNLCKDQIVSNDDIKRKVHDLTDGKEGIEKKVESIYNYITSEVRYVGLEFGIGGYKPRKATRVFSTHYGDCKDKGILFITMLKEIGVKADIVLVRTRSKGITKYDLPMLGLFNHFITLVHLPDRDLFIDATPEFSRYTELPFEDQDIDVFVIGEWGSKFMKTPLKSSEENFTDISMEIWLSKDGSATSKRTVVYGDKDSPSQRKRYLSPAQRKRLLEEYWNSLYPQSTISDLIFDGIENKTKNVSISYNLFIPWFGTIQNNIWRLPTRIPTDDLVKRYTSRSMRVYPLLMDEPFTIRSTIIYHLPEDSYIEGDIPLDIEMKSKFGSITANYTVDKNTLTAKIVITINTIIVQPEDYSALRSFLNECDVRESEQFTIKLKI
ncbi:MAG: DUF3857 domain-containing protein [bacterium]